jgi:8-amino-7-oxononanoate synthase
VSLDNSLESDYAGQELTVDAAQLASQGMLRRERLVEMREGARIKVDGRWLINFCSNDYLGLARHTKIIRAMQDAATLYGTGSSASPLVSGKSSLHRQLEDRLASMTGRDRVLLLSSGFAANLAIQSALVQSRHQVIIQDRLCHASMVDGSAIARARIKRYRHCDVQALEHMLAERPGASAIVMTESIFSMDGDMAPLPELAATCSKYGACLVVDDAHGFGVTGNNGLGALEHFSLGQREVPLMMATFGKALGVYGAFVAGPGAMIETLIQRARPYIYSTALPVPLIAATDAALEIMTIESWRRKRLTDLIRRFRAGAGRLGIRVESSTTPIQPIIIGAPDVTLECSKYLEQKGIFVSAIRPPTVPHNSSRLRITLSALHSEEQVDELLSTLDSALLKTAIKK